MLEECLTLIPYGRIISGNNTLSFYENIVMGENAKKLYHICRAEKYISQFKTEEEI